MSSAGIGCALSQKKTQVVQISFLVLRPQSQETIKVWNVWKRHLFRTRLSVKKIDLLHVQFICWKTMTPQQTHRISHRTLLSVFALYLWRRSSEAHADPAADSPDARGASGGRLRGLWREYYWGPTPTHGHMRSQGRSPQSLSLRTQQQPPTSASSACALWDEPCK